MVLTFHFIFGSCWSLDNGIAFAELHGYKTFFLILIYYVLLDKKTEVQEKCIRQTKVSKLKTSKTKA